MGMFDVLLDSQGVEWQTKAFDCVLETYQIRDLLPTHSFPFQVEILGGPGDVGVESFATVREGHLAEVDVERDESLPLMDYHGRIDSEAC